MALSPSDLLREKLLSFKTMLDEADQGYKKKPISSTIADNFNALLKEAKELYPDLTGLPEEVRPVDRMGHMPIYDTTYLDLKILVDQIGRLLSHVNKGN